MNARSELKVLTIGNSFSSSLKHCFPSVAKSAGCTLKLEHADFGGCEMARHWSYIEAEENSLLCRIYQGGRKLSTILEAETWDIVSIQQASAFSWRPESYHPYAENLHNYVKKHAPTAEVVIQQTWSYHRDHLQFQPGSEWGINQMTMYERLTENYIALAKDLKLRVIPTGYAVQLARAGETIQRPVYDYETLKNYNYPDLPPQAGNLVGKYYWNKSQLTGEFELGADLIHLNFRGNYLQACVWFASLFGRPTSEISSVPDDMGDVDAAELRRFAQQAVDEFPQV